MGELRVVLAERLHRAPYATVVRWGPKKESGSPFSIEIQSALEEGWHRVMLNETYSGLESQSLKHRNRFLFYCESSAPEKNRDLIDLK